MTHSSKSVSVLAVWLWTKQDPSRRFSDLDDPDGPLLFRMMCLASVSPTSTHLKTPSVWCLRHQLGRCEILLSQPFV